jgi:hypothetical protein
LVIHVEGPKELRTLLTDMLTDPRVGYSVSNGGARYAVKLEAVEGLPFVDGEGPLAQHMVTCVRELVGQRILVGGGTVNVMKVGVPSGLEEPVLRGVMRGLMRFGQHGKPWWRRLA